MATSKRRRRRLRGKRKEQVRKLRAEEAETWRVLNDTPAKRLARARKKALKEVRKMADILVGIQPMTAPAGEIFTIKNRYEGNGRDEDTRAEAHNSAQTP